MLFYVCINAPPRMCKKVSISNVLYRPHSLVTGNLLLLVSSSTYKTLTLFLSLYYYNFSLGFTSLYF